METNNPAIQYFEQSGRWLLTTAHTAYLFGRAADGRVQHLYWGERLLYPEDYSTLGPATQAAPSGDYDAIAVQLQNEGRLPVEEYPAWGGFFYNEPCLKVTFANGVRDLELVYARQRQSAGPDGLPRLIVTLKDKVYPLEVDLCYKIIAECDLIERQAVIRNPGPQPLDLEAALSGAWHLPAQTQASYRLTHLAGRWFADSRVRREALPTGKTTLESRRGLTSAEANPFFAVDLWDSESGGATEDNGPVWFGALGWSGNWKITLEQAAEPAQVYIAGGMHDFDFRWRLEAGEELATPAFTGGFTTAGFGQVSRNLHRYQLDYLLPRSHAKRLRQVIYNSWEAYFFDFNEAKQLELAERAARLGVELFVVDDGWFGHRPSDSSGLGDWFVSPEKFPQGLGPLIRRVNELGMDFGLWVEPESVNQDSDLYRAHPDWIYQFPGRFHHEVRRSRMLNLARPEVAAYIYERLDKLLSENNIAYIKWDFNRPITEPGWLEASPPRQREIYVRHITALYDLVDRLRAQHPAVVWEACSSGGARLDLGILRHFDQTWPSDNTDPYDRLFIQEGYSLAYAPKTMVAWVTESNGSREINNQALNLPYRFHSAMAGVLGLGVDLDRFTPAKEKEVAELVRQYKAIRPIVQDGNLYRLVSPRSGSLSALSYVSPDQTEAVVFVFRHTEHYWLAASRVRLRGLDPLRRYRVEGLQAGRETVASGQSLMSLGLLPELTGHFASALLRLKSV
jgi:alpha-galactosidase